DKAVVSGMNNALMEIDVMTKSLVRNGVSQAEASQRAVKLYNESVDQTILSTMTKITQATGQGKVNLQKKLSLMDQEKGAVAKHFKDLDKIKKQQDDAKKKPPKSEKTLDKEENEAERKALEKLDAKNKKEIDIINKRHLDIKNSEAVYNAELSAQDSAFLREKMTIYKKGSKEYEEIVATLSTNQVKQEQLVKNLLLQGEKELADAKIVNLKDGIAKEKAIVEQRFNEEIAGLKKRLVDIVGFSADEVILRETINDLIEEKTTAHNKVISDLNTASALEIQMDKALFDEAKAVTDSEKFAAERELAQAQYEQELADAKGNARKIEQAERKHSDNLIKIKRNEQARRSEIEGVVLDSAYNMFGALVELVGKETALGKALFAFQQAAAIGKIIVNTAVANSAALAEFPGPVGIALVVMNTISAAAGIANVVAQTAATFKGGDSTGGKKGKQSGGYADSSSSDSDPVGVYHANEFIASAPAVRNRTVKPVLDVIDIAQRTGTIKNLNLAGVLSGSRKSGGYASPGAGSSSPIVLGDPAQSAVLAELATELRLMRTKGIRANINKYGTNGLMEAYDDITSLKSKVNKQ
ncbi:MAG: hypothetical protein WCQ90_06830, partial [Deltaproteobacteria bacterium]